MTRQTIPQLKHRLHEMTKDQQRDLLLSIEGGEFLLRTFERIGLESRFIERTLLSALRDKSKTSNKELFPN